MKNAKDLVGVWAMESMQWEGEKKVMCGKERGYTQVKFYGADGEYACAEIALNKVVRYVVDCCKVKQTPADIKQQTKDKLFK